jgi:Ala-tRNA(Pro) deacylase
MPDNESQPLLANQTADAACGAPCSDGLSVFERVESLLKERGITFQVLRHEPVYTSDEASRVLGYVAASGAKALICKANDAFVMFVMPGNRKLASRAVRSAKHWNRLRFATREEVQELTGLHPGSIPPFGSLFGLPTLCDERLADNDVIKLQCRRPQRHGEHAVRGLRAGGEAGAGEVRRIGDDFHGDQDRWCSQDHL